MITLDNGATVLAADIKAFSGLPRGIVLAETETEHVTWQVVFDDNGWQTFNGLYAPKNVKYTRYSSAKAVALADYDKRRGVRQASRRGGHTP